jgi:hypothetical protein
MQNSHYAQPLRSVDVVDADDLEPAYWPRAQALNRALAKRSDPGMPLDSSQTLPYRFAKTKRCRRVANLDQIVPELPDDVALGTGKKFWRLATWFPFPVLGSHAIGFHRQPIPERVVSLDGLTGIQAFEKQSLQFIRRSFEVRDGHGFNDGEGGVQCFLGRTIGSRIDDGLNSPFLFGSELKRHLADYYAPSYLL